jgi:hypothetical protein
MAIDARQLRARGAYEARVPLKTLVDDADQIEKILLGITARRWKFRVLAGAAVLAGLAILIVSAALSMGPLAFGGLLVFVFGVVVFVYSFFDGAALIKSRDRVLIMKDLPKTLQPDADPRSAFSVLLELKSQPKLVSEEAWAARTNGKQRLFEEEVLSLEGKLLDGTVLTETVTELTRKRSFVNRNRKSKTKIRKRYLATVRFTYPGDVYSDARPAWTALQEEIRVPESATLRDTRVTEKAIIVKSVVILREDVAQTCAMMSLGAYRVLNLARRVAAGQS